MIRFKKTWADEIAEVTESREYQTADIEIVDTSGVVVGPIDWETGDRETSGTSVDIYRGQARIIDIRSATLIEGVDQSNATSLKSIRFQIPQRAAGHLHRGQTVRVTSCVANPTLERYVYRVNDDVQGSSAATRTFEAGVDLDSVWPD